MLAVTPSTPTGKLSTSLTAVALSITPTLPTAKLHTSVSAVVLQVSPILPTGWLQPHPVGIVLSITPTFTIGTVEGAAAEEIQGTTLVVTPVFPVGALEVATVVFGWAPIEIDPAVPKGLLRTSLSGVVLSISSSLPAGSFILYAAELAGVALSATPVLPTGSVTADRSLTGQVFALTPTLPTGEVENKLQVATTTIVGSGEGKVLVRTDAKNVLTKKLLIEDDEWDLTATPKELYGAPLAVAPAQPAGAMT